MKDEKIIKLFNKRDKRAIAEICKTDIRFMWILNGETGPSHATISRFIDEYLWQAAEELLYQLIMKLYELGEVHFKNIFVDGTKIEANANRYLYCRQRL